MKKIIATFPFLILLPVLIACRNKTVTLLSKQWDCVQVENIIPPGTQLLTAKDSADAEKLKSLLQNLSWTFKNNMRYECAVNGRVTVQGKYGLLENDRVLQCISKTTKTSNRYIIKSLTAGELVLSGNAENTNLVLHFRSH
jgi:hypothetical protein